ncbi:Zn-dependent peptidase ImmA, M78 family [Pedobacter westerhofensis]|uniref:Zn-dependent peptidase ImmA, M78 family n=2 Tax=Pedobacter westerhofensis TaxID=425512 RepID=A0A521FST1_9SPHI|nr:Zn-dependent peptidase ImmA, M78 family [Pedobacter westerhofensis]
MLSWAIARAGHDLRDFTTRFPKVQDWLSGAKLPTLKQLEEFSHRVHLPFGYLFLDQPPHEALNFPFFRTGGGQQQGVSLNVYDTILLIQKRQDWLAEYLVDNEFPALNYVGSAAGESNPMVIVQSIRQTLNLEPIWASRVKSWADALDHLAAKLENAGIQVVFNSVVENNNHRPIDVEECRGFILVDAHAPFMFVNAADGKAAQMFTIAHELAHIWIGQSAGFDMQQLLPADDPLEKLCDQVAAELLVPRDEFKHFWARNPNLQAMSRYFKVSPIVLARRALDLGKISKATFFQWYGEYHEGVKYKKENMAGGGDFYLTQKKRLGLRYVSLVDRAVREKQLLYREAYQLTGLKGDTYQNFINKL